MDINYLEKIKKLVIIAMFSDDDLMEVLVLKGGNALDIIYNVSDRGSIDIDFSIENEFKKEELQTIEKKIGKVLIETFRPEGYEVFDLSLREKPRKVSPNMKDFWGGYQVEFKVIEIEKYKDLMGKHSLMQSSAKVVGLKQRKIFRIDISKFEFCSQKQEANLDGYTIYVYTPEMILIEKIRAICQQMPEYRKFVVKPSQSPRARDFFDIYAIQEKFKIDLLHPKISPLVKNIFKAKRVPLYFIGKINEFREYHRQGFVTVKDTVRPDIDLKDFDFYFDFVVDECLKLKVLWIE